MINLGEYFNLPNPGLMVRLERNELGQPEVYTTPFFKNQSVGDVLEKWDKVLHTNRIPTDYPGMYSFESDLRAKVGPMSVMRPFSKRKEDVMHYYNDIKLPADPIDYKDISAVLDNYGHSNHIRLKSQQQVWNDLDSKSRGGGAPYMLKKKLVIHKTLPASVSTPDQLDTPTWHGKTAAFCGFRGQEGGPKVDDVKNRIIWETPLGEILCEGQFYQPKIAMMKGLKTNPHMQSLDAVDVRCTHLLQNKHPKDMVVCTDFTKYDQHFNGVCQDAASSIAASLLGDNGHPWLTNVFPLKFNVPLVCTKDFMMRGHHGMASGSYGTNADETDVQEALQHEAARLSHQTLSEFSLRNGDDGALTYPGIRVQDVVKSYTRHGLEMNESKQYVSSKDMVYLRNYHSLDYQPDGVCRGVYSSFRALGRLIYQERYYDPEHWGPKEVTLRAWSILENCKWHPCFESLVDYVCDKGDKYKLGLLIPGFMDDVTDIAHEAIETFADFLGYNKNLQLSPNAQAEGIKQWRIYQYLMSKAKR